MERAGVLLSQIQLHVSGACVGHGIGSGGVFYTSLPAVIDGKKRPAGHIGAFVVRHMKIVEAEHDAGKYIIDGHRPVAAFVSKLPHGAAVVSGEKPSALLGKLTA